MQCADGKYFKAKPIVTAKGEPWILLFGFVNPKKVGEQKRLWRQFREYEKQWLQEGYFGWHASTKIKNLKMVKLFDRLGAKEYAIYEGEVYFQKELLPEGGLGNE